MIDERTATLVENCVICLLPDVTETRYVKVTQHVTK